MPFLKAIVKETLRLRPVSIGVGRLTTKPMVIAGYQIPPGINIITQNQVSCQMDEYFVEAEHFRPERWLATTKKAYQNSNSNRNKFLWLPFGHGTRMCLGRRIAELEIYIGICRLVTNFKIEYDGDGDIGVRRRLINIPDRPMTFRLVDRV